jgi:hypothetical protein
MSRKRSIDIDLGQSSQKKSLVESGMLANDVTKGRHFNGGEGRS